MFTTKRLYCTFLICLSSAVLFPSRWAQADDQPQWGQRHSRNMVSNETGLPEELDPQTGKNIKWTAELGNQTYSTPIIAGGRVLIGTNNANPRDPRHKGDRKVLLCLDEKDGSLCWQLVIPKLGTDPYLDWPRVGLVSPATVEKDKVYIVSNRAEILCLDLNGQANGNDGPYRDEGRHMAGPGDEPPEVTGIDGDIIWLFDMPSGIGMHPHDSSAGSILIDGDFLYVNTSNGLDNRHRSIPCPDAPSLIALDKKTGRLLAKDDEGMGPNIVHCVWSSPAMGEVNGRKLVFFGGGDGICYAFEALKSAPPAGTVEKLKLVWRFDCDPEGPKEDIHQYMGNRQVSASTIKGMPVFHNNRVYVTAGGDIWWGKRKAWLKCIDATKTGDITKAGQIWSYSLEQHCCSTPSIRDGLVFVADCGDKVHCVDAETGKACWVHDTGGEMWASTLVADGKVYAVTRRGDLWILAASKEKKVISSVRLDSSIVGSPVAANGTLYVATMKKLYAVQADIR